MNRKLFLCLAILAALALPALAGEYHSGNNLVCADCHTMHFSMQHDWIGNNSVPNAPPASGVDATMNWLGATGPNAFLLKAPANTLCLTCHDGLNSAPDVLALNTNSYQRSAGAVNEASSGTPYETWKGHTLDSTTAPPGFDPAVIGAPATWYDPTGGLECISCHAQHGPATAYRNLGSYGLGGAATAARPTYAISTTNDTTKDVWINIAAGYVAGSGSAATFGPYYDQANVSFNRNDATVGTTKTSNRMDTFCASCHGDFHGGPGDVGIGASAAVLDGFIRHPTSQVTIGASGVQGYGGHSSLSRYVANTTKVRVYASDRTGYTDATPGCVSCHKAHGNQNPFALVYLNGNAASVDEQGGWKTGQVGIGTDQQGTRNLCGQCHSQGN